MWACRQSRSLGLNLSRKTLSLLLWHLLEANRPLEEVLRVYSVIRNLKLGVDAKTAQFIVKSALQHGHVNAAAGYCVQFMQAGVKVNRKTPTAIMNAAIEHNLPNAAIAVERSWNKEQPQLPKAPFDRLALAQAYALLADEDECIRAAKSILDTLDDSFSEEFKNSTSQNRNDAVLSSEAGRRDEILFVKEAWRRLKARARGSCSPTLTSPMRFRVCRFPRKRR